MSHRYTEEEDILIIDLYTRTDTKDINDRNPNIIQLCNELRSYGSDVVVSGIRFKMENLKSVDAEYTADGHKGLVKIEKKLKDLWLKHYETGFSNLEKDVDRAWSTIISEKYPDDRERIYSKSREGQDIFRERVLAAYESTCCITGLKERGLLQACHIKPYSVCINEKREDQSMDIRNGLCMNTLYHGAFDRGLISVDEDLRIMFSPSLKLDADDKLFRPYEGKKIFQSHRACADELYLDYHRKHVFIEIC